jgi:hypothetical protein
MRKAWFIVLGFVFMALSCKKAEPVRSSSKNKENIQKEEKDILTTYKMVEFGSGWQVPQTGNDIGYNMNIYLYKDSTFKKRWSTAYSHQELKGVFRDTVYNAYTALLLKYTDANPEAGGTGDNYIYYNIQNKSEVLFPLSVTQVVSINLAVAGGPYFKYEKQ